MADFAEQVRGRVGQVGTSIATQRGAPPPAPPAKVSRRLSDPPSTTKEVPPELQQIVDEFAAKGITIPPETLSMMGGGAGSDRLALLGISDAVSSSPVKVRNGDASSLGTAPTLGRSSYRPPEVKTMVDVLEDFWDLGRADLIDVQQRLWAGGFFGEGDPPAFGGDLNRTFEAYRDAVLLAAQSGKSLMEEILNADADAAPSKEVTNREDIRVLLERVAPEAIGRKLSAEETERAVAAWHAREQQVPQDGEAPLSNEANLDLTLGEVAPGEEDVYSFAKNAQAFFQMLDSPVS